MCGLWALDPGAFLDAVVVLVLDDADALQAAGVMTGTRSTMMRWAAMAMACRPEAHRRLTVVPPVSIGRPPHMAICRPML